MPESINGMELMGQYINIILQRINFANQLNNEQKPYLALLALKPAIRALLAATDEEKIRKRFNDWIQEIDNIDNIQGEGATSLSRENSLWKRRNAAAMILYEELETAIWNDLGDMGFFNIKKMIMWNPSQGAKTGEQKPRQGLPMQMSAYSQVKEQASDAEGA